jgi:hypothetical protein
MPSSPPSALVPASLGGNRDPEYRRASRNTSRIVFEPAFPLVVGNHSSRKVIFELALSYISMIGVPGT